MVFCATFVINIVANIAQDVSGNLADTIQVYIPEIDDTLVYTKNDLADGTHDILSSDINFESGIKPSEGYVKIENGELKDYTFVYEDKYITSINGNTEIKDIVKNPQPEMDKSETVFVNVKEYGAKGDGVTDDTLAIRAAVNYINSDTTTDNLTLYFPKGTYKVSILKGSYGSNVSFDEKGNLKSFTDGETGGNVFKITNTTAKSIVVDFGQSTLKLLQNSLPAWQVISAVDSKNLTIKNGTIIGDRKEHIYLARESGLSQQYETHGHAHGMRLVRCENVYVENMDISNMAGDGICISGKATSVTNISNCNIHHCRRQGITVSVSDTTNVINTKIQHIGTSDGVNGTSPMAGIDIEPSPRETKIAKNVNLDNVSITNVTNFGLVVRWFGRCSAL